MSFHALPRPARRAALACAAAVVSLGVVTTIAAIFGESPARFLSVLVSGAALNPGSLSESLVKAVPLLLTSLSVLLAFRAGVWNIGAEGQFIVGAIAGFLAARAVPLSGASAAAALLASVAAGAAWGWIAAWLKLTRNTPEVLSTILLNFVAIHLLGYCVNGPLQERGGEYPQTDSVPAGSFLPTFGDGRLHFGAVIAVCAAVAVYWLLYRTPAGLKLRASGYNPAAARFAGVDVRREVVRAMALSGALAGLAGGVELLGVTHRLFERFAAGYGYSAIAVALVAQLDPLASIASSIFFGLLAGGSGELQRAGVASASIAVLLQGVVILVILLFASPRVTLRMAGLRRLRFRGAAPETQP